MKSFGSDPEFLLTQNNKSKSAIEIIKADFENPIKFNGHRFYYDNVLAECAIKPSFSKEETISNFSECFKFFAELVDPAKLNTIASADFDDQELKSDAARKVNCAKDTCAYEMNVMDGPVHAIKYGNLRSCGGHIHLGSEILASDGSEPILAVYMLDLILGTTSLWLDKDASSSARRFLYGQAGRYRVKNYGIEYRPLGNFWLGSPSLVGLIYDLCEITVDLIESGKAWEFWSFDLEKFYESEVRSDAWKCLKYDSENLRTGINCSNKKLVKDHFDLVLDILPKNIKNNLITQINKKQKPDFYKNWNI